MNHRECFKCHATLPGGAKFCQNCVKQVTSKSTNSDQFNHSIFDRSQSMKELEVIQVKKAATFKKIALLIAVSSLMPIVALRFYLVDSWLDLPVVSTIFFSIIFIAYFPLYGAYRAKKWLKESEYYQIHGSKIVHQHRCIFCGANGIYRKGEYRTSNVYALCSKCGNSLFKKNLFSN